MNIEDVMERLKLWNQINAQELMEKAKNWKAMSSYQTYKSMFEGNNNRYAENPRNAFVFKK